MISGKKLIIFIALVIGSISIFFLKKYQENLTSPKKESVITEVDSQVITPPEIQENDIEIENNDSETNQTTEVPVVEEKVVKIEEVKLEPPQVIATQILEFVDHDENPFHRLHIPENKDAKNYLIEIYKDQKLKKLVKKETLKKNVYTWPGISSGKYFYRLRIKDKNGHLSPYSKVAEFIFPVSPLDEI